MHGDVGAAMVLYSKVYSWCFKDNKKISIALNIRRLFFKLISCPIA